LSVHVAYITHAGVAKSKNQDALLINDLIEQSKNSKLQSKEIVGERIILAVSDGVSSSPKPDMASRLTLEHLSKIFTSSHPFMPTKSIKNIQEQISRHTTVDKSFKNSCCTLAGIAIENRQIKIFNVGDSRIYLLQNGKIKQLSHDHTVLNRYIKEGVIENDSLDRYANNYKMLDSYILANFDADDFAIHVSDYLQISNDDIYLICSDGLTDALSDKKIESIMNTKEIEVGVWALFENAVNAGAQDDISIMVCKILSANPKAAEKNKGQ
jgi:PPM family protein phosphatase